MMHRFELLAEVLAGHVDAPLGGVVAGGPAVDAAVEDRNAGVAQPLQGGGGQRSAPSVVIAGHDSHALGRHRFLDNELNAAAGYKAGPGNVGTVVFAGFPNVYQGEGRVTFEQTVQFGVGN